MCHSPTSSCGSRTFLAPSKFVCNTRHRTIADCHLVDIDILKPDSGKMHIERPSHSNSASTSGGVSPIASTPDLQQRRYTEPVSEGEEDDDYAVAPALYEQKAAGLSGEEVEQVIAERNRSLEEVSKETSTKDRASTSKPPSPEHDDGEYAADDERVPLLGQRRVSLAHARPEVKQRALSINPLAPSNAFDKSFQSKLTMAMSSEQDESALDDPESEAAGVPAGARMRGDDRELVRFWTAAPGQRIAVPVRVEPKVYFASERTFLVCLLL